MPWFSKPSPDDEARKAQARAMEQAAAERAGKWEQALARGGIPDFVRARLGGSASGRAPWTSTMTPAELLLTRRHGGRPIAMVTGTCWFQYGRSWTEGHASGWRTALERLRSEARACGANAVVDVKLRTSPGEGASMDYTLIGFAMRFDGLPENPEPIVATTPALELVRLLEASIVPVGIAIGAHYEWITDYNNSFRGSVLSGNRALNTLGNFWESIRRQAHAELRQDAASQGNGVLAHTHFGEILRQEVDKQPDQYLGRHIVLGTVVDTPPRVRVPHEITPVVDMRDELSPLIQPRVHSNNVFHTNEQEGAI